MDSLPRLKSALFTYLDHVKITSYCKVRPFVTDPSGKTLRFVEERTESLIDLVSGFIAWLPTQGVSSLVGIRLTPGSSLVPDPSASSVPNAAGSPQGRKIPADPALWAEEDIDVILEGAKAAHKKIVEDIKAIIQEKAKFQKVCKVCGKRPLTLKPVAPGEDSSGSTWSYERGIRGAGFYHKACWKKEEGVVES